MIFSNISADIYCHLGTIIKLGFRGEGGEEKEGKMHKNEGKGLNNASFWVISSKNFSEAIFLNCAERFQQSRNSAK